MSVTALAGSSVAYEFEPHGIKFPVPSSRHRASKGTQAQSRRIDQSSFAVRRLLPGQQAITSVSELLDLNVNVLARRQF